VTVNLDNLMYTETVQGLNPSGGSDTSSNSIGASHTRIGTYTCYHIPTDGFISQDGISDRYPVVMLPTHKLFNCNRPPSGQPLRQINKIVIGSVGWQLLKSNSNFKYEIGAYDKRDGTGTQANIIIKQDSTLNLVSYSRSIDHEIVEGIRNTNTSLSYQLNRNFDSHFIILTTGTIYQMYPINVAIDYKTVWNDNVGMEKGDNVIYISMVDRFSEREFSDKKVAIKSDYTVSQGNALAALLKKLIYVIRHAPGGSDDSFTVQALGELGRPTTDSSGLIGISGFVNAFGIPVPIMTNECDLAGSAILSADIAEPGANYYSIDTLRSTCTNINQYFSTLPPPSISRFYVDGGNNNEIITTSLRIDIPQISSTDDTPLFTLGRNQSQHDCDVESRTDCERDLQFNDSRTRQAGVLQELYRFRWGIDAIPHRSVARGWMFDFALGKWRFLEGQVTTP
jgi:hypothetical protein